MTSHQPTILLVHGAFADSASWNGVIEQLQQRGIRAMAVANPLRSVSGDAAYVRDVAASVDGPVILVGHSYGGIVITEAAAANDSVVGLVYVAAFVPESGHSALELSQSVPGGTLGDALVGYPVSSGGTEYAIRPELFRQQFAADVPVAVANLMAATQRPVTENALSEGLGTRHPAWRDIPSWHVFGDRDLNIPVEVMRTGAERAASRGTREITGASHAVPVSQPGVVAEVIVEAVAAHAASFVGAEVR